MNRIIHAYDSAVPDEETLDAGRMMFLEKLDKVEERPPISKTTNVWHIAAAAAACLVIATAAVGAFTGKMSIANTSGDISAVEELGIDLPEMIGDFKQRNVTYHNWVRQGDEDLKSILDPMYRSYTVTYVKELDIAWQDIGPLADPDAFNGVHDLQTLSVGVGSSEGFSAEDWERFAGYDGETKGWIPNGILLDEEKSTVSYENVEVIEYRGATIWIYDVMKHNKSSEPEYTSDAGAHWYDPEKECYFQIDFGSPSYHKNTSTSYDKDGNLLHQANESWIREYSYLSKAELLGYIKEIIDLNR